ncbi:MAG: DNA mismatch repair endonuclease MutL [Christensenellales bacterium]
MGNIRILDKSVYEKIAAGEVIERPASVIKELVENSIDAGATTITVEIKGGGVDYMRVTDNGRGIAAEDAELSFLRHATSKVYSEDDLNAISTLGFRGEALCSVAAVASAEITTRPEPAETGVYVKAQGGEILETRQAGCPAGTTVQVRKLFFNTPARLKFLKKAGGETAQVTDLVSRFILSKPKISFKYISNGRIIYHSPGDGMLRSAVYCIYGGDVAKMCSEIDYAAGNLSFQGLAGAPDAARANRTHQTIFVNGRYIKSAKISFTVARAYGNRLMTGKFPFFVLNIDLPFDAVDVNIHPNKLEVRFRNEDEVMRGVFHAVSEAMPQETGAKSLLFDRIEEQPALDNSNTSDIAPGLNKDFFKGSQMQIDKPDRLDASDLFINDIDAKRRGIILREDDDVSPHHDITARTSDEPPASEEMQAEQKRMDGVLAGDIEVMGALFDTYILAQYRDELIMIDQHAAHERLLYDEYKAAFDRRAVVSQPLLSPEVVEITAAEKELVMENLELFSSLGFVIEDFGAAIAVRETPMLLGQPQPRKLIPELLDRLDSISFSQPKLKREALIMSACKHAAKGGDKLNQAEILALIEDTFKSESPLTCPHGRPIIIRIKKYDIEKSFKRQI